MKTSDTIVSFKTDVILTRTGEKTGRCKHSVWAVEATNGSRMLRIRKLTLCRIEPGVEYLKTFKGYGVKIEHLVFQMGSFMNYAHIAIKLNEELNQLPNETIHI